MPLYEYDCKKCGTRFEHLQYGADDAPECPKCGSRRLEKAFSVFAPVAGGRNEPPPECGRGACDACRID
jgi:putative FmdB family regulatory protein